MCLHVVLSILKEKVGIGCHDYYVATESSQTFWKQY